MGTRGLRPFHNTCRARSAVRHPLCMAWSLCTSLCYLYVFESHRRWARRGRENGEKWGPTHMSFWWSFTWRRARLTTPPASRTPWDAAGRTTRRLEPSSESLLYVLSHCTRSLTPHPIPPFNVHSYIPLPPILWLLDSPLINRRIRFNIVSQSLKDWEQNILVACWNLF